LLLFKFVKFREPFIMRVLTALALLVGTSAFSPQQLRPVSLRPKPLPLRVPLEASRELDQEPAQKTQFGSVATTVTPDMMNEGIFNFNKLLVDSIYVVISTLYANNDYARFFVLETVARVPYFAYLSVMHLRETFGERDDGNSERMRTHYAEADNELHHLLIMESLGGNASPFDRVLAQTMAFAYYWYVIVVYSLSEQAAYHLSELIEDHAFNTYDKFLKKKGDELKKLPVPDIARKYYEEDNPFLFDLFCTVKEPEMEGGQPMFSRSRPKLDSLYDVFLNVRNDEREHWKTLCNLVQYDSMVGTGAPIQSSVPAPPEPAPVA